MGGNKDPQQIAEEIMEEADQDVSMDDLTRGTEVYEEFDDEVEGEEGDPQELDFEPSEESHRGFTDDFDGSGVADAFVGEDDY